MKIETEPCESCDFSPAVCGCEIELCMMNRRNKADYGINPANPLIYKDDGLRRFANAEKSDIEREFRNIKY